MDNIIYLTIGSSEYKIEIPEGAISFDYYFALNKTDYVVRVCTKVESIKID
jgi:hypothetical protein